MKRYNIVAIVAICLLCLLSCTERKGKQTETATIPTELRSFTDGLVKEDTLAVQKLVNDYMTYVQNGEYAEAAAMLYKPDSTDIWNEPIPLSNEEMEKVIETLKLFPVQSHEIKDIKFKTAIENEVKCTFTIKGSQSISSSISFKPMNYLGGWRLCLSE
ncbi:MAG: hypothetical protein V8T55_04195 [Phocaeicola plebeius]